ncbi:hypothetical protein [Microbacterium sp. NPDC056736]|uniref:hypothetical protein n=1 Tax=Microbacterium sp. NPDC056736 TaxID=3345932 RepID=UPI0036709091
MRPFSGTGIEVDSEFAVESENDLLAVILESRGGASPGSAQRNPDYNVALDLLLSRLAQLRATVVDAFVDSVTTRQLPLEKRRIVAAQINLDNDTDVPQLRAELGKAAAAVNRAPNASGEGNRTRRIKLLVAVPGYAASDHATLAVALARPSLALDVSPTAVRGFLRSLIGTAIPTVSGSRHNTILAVDSRNVTVATDRTPTGQPVPISEVAAAMELTKEQSVVDVSVDVLGYRSAFIGAVLLQLPGARVVGASPARVVIGDLLAGDLNVPNELSSVDVGPFQGTLDRPATVRQRREQQQLRAALLRGRAEAECELCGEKYPARFLWASHIKKRAAATDQEARDIPRVAMLACVFGCDALFEDGYVSVENGTIVGAASVAGSAAIGRRIGQLRGRSVDRYADAAVYFDWHRAHVFMS